MVPFCNCGAHFSSARTIFDRRHAPRPQSGSKSIWAGELNVSMKIRPTSKVLCCAGVRDGSAGGSTLSAISPLPQVFIKPPPFSFFWVAPGRCGGRIGWDSVAFWGPFWSTFWVHFRVQILEPFWTLPGWPWGILMVPFGSLFGPKRAQESIHNRGPERGASEVMARG